MLGVISDGQISVPTTSIPPAKCSASPLAMTSAQGTALPFGIAATLGCLAPAPRITFCIIEARISVVSIRVIKLGYIRSVKFLSFRREEDLRELVQLFLQCIIN